MSRAFDLLKWSVTLGRDRQNFLGARWVPFFLSRVPQRSRRKWALRILDLSPHYFLNPSDPKYYGLKKDEYLETVFADCARSREDIWTDILSARMSGAETVIDYGCGPGFLTKAVSPHVERIYGFDISEGALACARIVNAGANIDYLKADESGLLQIPDASVDAVCTFAVFQHLTDEVLSTVLANISRKLKTGGRLVAHVQLPTERWRTETEWRSDNSVKGRLKFRYGLHCFARSRQEYLEALKAAGFVEIVFEPVDEMVAAATEPLDGQFIIAAVKN